MISVPDHNGFLADLRDGRAVEMWVAAHLLDAGLTVKIGALDQAETPFEADRFSDETDILVDGRHLLEVKSSSYPFTGPDDWPFAGAFTCTVKRWATRPHKPVAFVVVSVPTKAIVAISAKTFQMWETIDSHDRRRNWVTPTFRAPRSCIRPFDELVRALVEKGNG